MQIKLLTLDDNTWNHLNVDEGEYATDEIPAIYF